MTYQSPPPYGAPPPYGHGQGYPGYPAGYPGGYPPGYPAGYAQPQSTNSMAIASLVCAFLFAPLGIVFGHISLSQIRKTGEEGRGMAVAGLVISYLLTALSIIILVATVVFAAVLARTANDAAHLRRNFPNTTAWPSTPDTQLPAFNPPPNLGANCTYPATAEPASKPNKPPRSGKVPTEPAKVAATITTNQGNIGLQLDNAKSPCTVNSFVSLAQQGYFDNTSCHRLTTSPSLGLLQCGDPSGTGQGGPGYRFANEYPTNQYRLADPALKQPVVYPRGTLAMANSGAGSNGSQFFMLYEDSQLPPTYTVFGTIDQVGLATVDTAAAGGVVGGGQDGKPETNVKITSVRLD